MHLPENKHIILFDGVCLLCNRLVQKIIQYDHKDNFRFVALQSSLGQEICTNFEIPNRLDTLWVCTPSHQTLQKSEALFTIVRVLSGRFRILLCLRIFPRQILNLAYDYIAKNRLLWFGARESCYLPTSEIQNKFL